MVRRVTTSLCYLETSSEYCESSFLASSTYNNWLELKTCIFIHLGSKCQLSLCLLVSQVDHRMHIHTNCFGAQRWFQAALLSVLNRCMLKRCAQAASSGVNHRISMLSLVVHLLPLLCSKV